MIERHYTLDRAMVGFDYKMSLEPDELIAMVRDIRAIRVVGSGKRVSDTNGSPGVNITFLWPQSRQSRLELR